MKILERFNNIKLPVKMAIIGALGVLSVAIPTFLFLMNSAASISTAEKEIRGLKPSSKTVDVMRKIATTRGISLRYLAGEETLNAEVMAKATEAESALTELYLTIDSSIKTTKTSQDISSIKMKLLSLARAVQSKNLDILSAYERFSTLNSEAYDLLREIKNKSNLRFNSKPDTSYLISAEFTEFPYLIESIGKIRGYISGPMAMSKLKIDEDIQLKTLLSNTSYYAQQYLLQIGLAAESNQSLNTNEYAVKSGLANIEELIEKIRTLSDSKASIIQDKKNLFTQMSQTIDMLYQTHSINVEALEVLIAEQLVEEKQTQTILLVVIFALLVLSAVAGYFIVKSINSAVQMLGNAATKISVGDYSQKIKTGRKDELGELAESLDNMNSQLKSAAVSAAEAKRVKQALDNTTSNVMIANTDREIIYVNSSAIDLFKNAEKDIQKALPKFYADKILGSNFDIFHKNPKHQKDMMAELQSTYKTQIKIANRYFYLVASPIFTDSGDHQGTVVEWLDRTDEVKAEEDISMLISSAIKGDFSNRAEVGKKEGFMKTVAEGLNQIFDLTENGLKDVSKLLLALSKGNMTESINNEYQGMFNELVQYSNTTTQELSSMIGEVREASFMIQSASNEIAQGNADLSSRTEEQASSLEETASSMEELTGTVKLNAENANRASSLASKATNVAADGGQLIEQVVSTMSSINESAQKISDIIGVIDGIAFQTNILALNAAVEAARAGEQGRGFAVVASEVRTLAQRSATAAKDIKALISDSVSRIDSGNQLVNQSGKTMSDIVESIKRVNDLMAEIAAASAEQASGIDEVSKAVTQMDDVTQQNAALVEEAAASAESLTSQATQLTANVSRFKIDDSFVVKQSSERPKPTDNVGHNFQMQGSVSSPMKSLKVQKPSKPVEDDWENF
jgi:methyl-accepting chemotaxis protein